MLLVQKLSRWSKPKAKKVKKGESLKRTTETECIHYSWVNQICMRFLKFLRCFIAKMVFLICLSISLKLIWGGVGEALCSRWFLSRHSLYRTAWTVSLRRVEGQCLTLISIQARRASQVWKRTGLYPSRLIDIFQIRSAYSHLRNTRGSPRGSRLSDYGFSSGSELPSEEDDNPNDEGDRYNKVVSKRIQKQLKGKAKARARGPQNL